VATTWDPNNTTAGCALSGGNLTATCTNTSSVCGTRATRIITGPTYFELKPTSLTGGTLGIGVATFTWISNFSQLGTSTNNLGYFASGAIKFNGSTVQTIQTFAVNNIVQFAFSLRLQQYWINVNNGNWNNNGAAVVSDDPAVAAGGFSFPAFTGNSLQLLPAFDSLGAASNTNAVTAQFSSGSWTYSAPSGFASIDAVGTSGGRAVDLPSSTAPYSGAARQDPFSGSYRFKTMLSAAAGAWYGISKNTPNTAVKIWSPAATATHVSGTVTESGVPVAKIVRIYDHNTGDFLGETTSSAVDGSYSIPGLGRSNVVAIAFDLPSYDALVWDGVAPV
jgi:hypothetical protein